MAGTIKHTWSRAVKNDAGNTVVSETTVFTATSEVNIRETVAASSNDDIVAVIDTAAIESFFVKSDKAVTLKTYDGATLKQTIALAANVALIWNADDLAANPLTDDFTKMNFDNAGLVVATIVAGFLLNS